jgi:hypothetical protein
MKPEVPPACVDDDLREKAMAFAADGLAHSRVNVAIPFIGSPPESTLLAFGTDDSVSRVPYVS